MNARETALAIIDKVMYEGAYASLMMRRAAAPEEGMALVSELVYGTIRHYSFLDYQWVSMTKKKPKHQVHALINLAAYQLFFMKGIPDYAVIDECVSMAGPHEKGFVNAMLRQMLRNGIRYSDSEDPLTRQSINCSVPLWILRLWTSHYGLDTALRLAEYSQGRACVYGRVNSLLADVEAMKNDPKVHFVNERSFTYDGILSRSDWFKEGMAVIQDVSSATIPELLQVREGMRVLDCCAAPGTKTQQIAALMNNRGEIIAMDLYSARLNLIPELMKKTGVSIVKTISGDAGELRGEFMEHPFDRILIDAPCSGLGDLRHKPEIRWRLKAEDLDQLVRTQERILSACSQYLVPGGILVYSTCTLNRKENEQQAASFLRQHSEFELISENTFFPFEHDSDGFYAAVMRKKGFS